MREQITPTYGSFPSYSHTDPTHRAPPEIFDALRSSSSSSIVNLRLVYSDHIVGDVGRGSGLTFHVAGPGLAGLGRSVVVDDLGKAAPPTQEL